MLEEDAPVVKKKMNAWGRLKTRSTLAPLEKGTKWNPAIGKYCFLNKIWVPVHKIMFLDPSPQVCRMNLK